MAGPQVVGSPQSGLGVGTLQQGMASLQQAFQFLEQKRQFEEDQTRLNRMQDANWSWTMVKELITTTDSKSIKELALKYPSLLSQVFQKGMGVDEATAMPWITSMAQSPDNHDEANNRAHSILMRFGNGDEDAQKVLKEATATVATEVGLAAGRKSVPAGTTPAPVAVKPDFSTTTPVPARAVSGDATLVDFKAKLNGLVSGMKIDPKLGMTAEQRQAVDALVGQYQGKSPAVDEFIKTGMGDYAGRVANAGGTLGTEQLQRSPIVLKQNLSPEAQAPLRTTSPTAGGQTVAPSTPPVPDTMVSEKSTPQIGDAFQSFKEALDSGSTGQVAQKGKKLTKAISPYVAQQMEQNPEGIKALVQNSLWIATNPENLRMMAMEQNAPSVYATDQERSMTGAQGNVAAQKYFLELQKLGYETEKARLAMIREGINGKEDQAKMIAASITASMLSSGVLPTEMAASLRANLESMNKQKAIIDKLQADKADVKTIDDATSQYNAIRSQYFLTLKAAKEAIGQTNTPEAKALAASMDQRLQFTDYTGWFGRRKKGALKMTTPQAQMPTMTQEAADLSKELGL
jgi:hypothetical protein